MKQNNSKTKNKNLGFNSNLIHAGHVRDVYGSAVTPIFQTSTFTFENVEEAAACFSGEHKGYMYSRIGNPTLTALENKLAILENGYGAILTSSGMSAISNTYMTLLGQDQHIICSDAVYGPSRSILSSHFAPFGVESTFVDTSDPENIRKAIQPNTSVIYIESPANPTIKLSDIAEAAKIARENNLILVVDNTFASPYLQKPLELGADVVIYSLTKSINGHADIIGGAIITKDKNLHDQLRKTMVYMGSNMDPHQAFLIDRGLKTLALRIDRSQENAKKIAGYLESHPLVDWVRYPGLRSHPQYLLAQKQMKGPGSMISFGLKGGLEAGKKLMNNMKLAALAVSLGGVESLIQHPASMTHAGVSKAEKESAGISDDLIRYSVGIEDVEDLINDLEQALQSSNLKIEQAQKPLIVSKAS